MPYVDEYLPECVAYGFSGGPEWDTLITPRDNGRENRNRKRLYPKHRYSAAFQNLPEEGRDAVLTFFYAMAGRWGAFRLRDPNNHDLVNEPQAPNIGTSEPLQLTKAHTVGILGVTQLVMATVDGEFTMTKDGLPFTAFTIDHGRGLITPDAPWAAGTYLATGPFDIWVRFDSDFNAFSIDDLDAHNSAIELVEVWRND